MKTLSVDLETYSEVDIKTAGLHKYAASAEIMLFGYSPDGAYVDCVDLLSGGKIPQTIFNALTDPSVVKYAHNAPFEIEVLCAYFNLPYHPEQWRCSAIRASVGGYPSSLGEAAKALGAAELKDTEGKALIRYFCIPCTPTKANGMRTRNLPIHAPDKWAKFIAYCIQDVLTEQAITNALSFVHISKYEQDLWVLDQQINRRGWKVDADLMEAALEMDEVFREELMQEARSITGLVNPNSPKQLSEWLSENEGVEVTTLTKDSVLDMLSYFVSPTARRVLDIRQELSKTSVKKYATMQRSITNGDRLRGLFQFYGASRTGRFCLTGDHEVLTPQGWVRLDVWAGGLIACWTPQGEVISFKRAAANRFHYSGDMFRIESQRCSQVSTPEHTMPYWDNGWKSDEVRNLKNRFKIPFTGTRFNPNNREDFGLRVLIMTQADGHYSEANELTFHFSKQRKIDRCKNLLRKADILFRVTLNKDTTTIRVSGRDTPLYLRNFREKVFGYWLLNENPDIFFDELEHWDAYRCGPNSVQYSSIKEKNVDIVQAMAVLSGRSCTKITKNTSGGQRQIAYVANIWLTPGKNCEIRKEFVTSEEFSGEVFCPTTKTGFFMVRRDGKVWVTGNSGRIVQPQNLPRITFPDIMEARKLVKERDYAMVKLCFGSLSVVLSQLIRTTFIADHGKRLIISDFSAIEARVLAWIADEEWVLEVFRTHGKIYESTAAKMLNKPIEEVTKSERQRGKVATLALGYQGGDGALIAMGALDMGLTLEELDPLKNDWREANKNITKLWYEVQNAAMRCIETGALQTVGNRGIDFTMKNGSLLLNLPSRRSLYFPKVAIENYIETVEIYLDVTSSCVVTRKNTTTKQFLRRERKNRRKITFWTVDSLTRKWEKSDTYGGKLVENICQAISRDILCNAMLNLTEVGYRIVSHVHDECILEMPINVGSIDEVNKLMIKPLEWMRGLPLKAEGGESQFYNK